MTDRNADMRHILGQIHLISGGTVVDEAAMSKKSLNQGMPAKLPATPKNIENARKFVFNKWIDRFHERYPLLAAQEPKHPDYPVDLSYSCKFTSLFAQAVFGGTLRGNEGHQYVELPNGDTLDLNIDATDVRGMQERFAKDGRIGWYNDDENPGTGSIYHGDPHSHDPEWFGNRDHVAAMRTVMPRVADWAKQFIASKGKLTESADPVWKWWVNVETGQFLPVTRAHGDMTHENPEQFGITRKEIEHIKAEYPDLNPDDDPMSSFTWWELIRYEAQKKGWVRVGTEQEGQEVARPYVYAASVKQAQKAITLMMRKAMVIDSVEIELTDPYTPLEGYGEFMQLDNEAEIRRFMQRRA